MAGANALCKPIDVLVFVVLDLGTGLLDVIRMAHTVIPPPRCSAATLELTHKGNLNDKTISGRDREVRDFNVIMLASAITRRRHLVIDTHRTDLGVTRQGCHYIHEMIRCYKSSLPVTVTFQEAQTPSPNEGGGTT